MSGKILFVSLRYKTAFQVCKASLGHILVNGILRNTGEFIDINLVWNLEGSQ